MLTIRECTDRDVEALERVAPSGLNDVHGGRFRRQQSGESSYLVAVSDGVPVGHAEIAWNGCPSVDVRQRYPNCPEISGLSVFPAELRGQGIGTAIVRDAEDRARIRGFAWIGLGVDDENPGAARLYERLGYVSGIRYVFPWSYLDDNGVEHVVADPGIFMVRNLAS